MFDRSLLDLLAHVVSQSRQFLGFLLSHRGKSGGGQVHPEYIPHQLGQTIFGDKLPILKIDHQRRDGRSVLRRRRHIFRKRGLRLLAAVRTVTSVGAMFPDFYGLRLWQIEYLPPLVSRRGFSSQSPAATRT